MKASALTACLTLLGLTAAAEPPATFTEKSSGVSFAIHKGEKTLLGAALRIKKIAFISAKVYAVALYVNDAALAGPLAVHKGQTKTDAFYNDLQWMDVDKELVLHFTRNVGKDKIQEAMREALVGTDPRALDAFVSYFPEVKEGEECVLRWAPGGVLESTMAGQPKPPIANKEFTAQVFGLYVGPKPLQADIKVAIVGRAEEALKR